MIERILNLPFALGLLLFILAFILFGLLNYYVVRFLTGKPSKDDFAIAESIFRISGTLLGLILSLTFADVRLELIKLRDSVELESAQIADIFNDLKRHNTQQAEALQQLVVAYTTNLIEDEWSRLAVERLSSDAWEKYETIQIGLLNLPAESEIHNVLKARMLQDIDEISDHRQNRLNHAKADPPVFLNIAIFGFAVTMGLLCVYPSKPKDLIFMSFYAAFIGVVIYFILELSHPFDGMFRVSAKPLQIVYRDMISGERT